MLTPVERKALVIGLPKTGKTTFLAALWDVVNSGEIPTSLQLERLDGDKHHLNDIRSLWADCNEIPRTRQAGTQMLSMRLRDPATIQLSEVHLPDMDGESFEQQWTERACSDAYAGLVRAATGALLFIHPQKVNEAPLITDAQRLISVLLPDNAAPSPDSSGGPATGGDKQILPAEPHYAATQVMLVELLQFIRGIRGTTTPFRLCVLLSAWDVVPGHPDAVPEKWLKKRLPLLHQYLFTNSDVLPSVIYGVSAQGGDLSDAAQLRKALRSSDRIIVARGKGTSHDITEPLRWLFGSELGDL